ncbi:MAG: HAD family hydrolase [Acidobacteriota bacterium]|jgi:D-glycero-D-manno-heptose 1,7-bisphosphate phosphatase
MSRAGVFMDRDGTVSQEVGYMVHLDRYALLPRSVAAIRRINAAGMGAFVATNQSGVARGLFSEDLVRAVHRRLEEWLAEGGARLDGIYYCPHHPREGEGPWSIGCDCRKPRPGMLRRAAAEHDIDLSRSYMIGDTGRDLGAGAAAGATPILVLTGYGRGELEHLRHRWTAEPAFIAEDLAEAVGWILEREGRR